MLSAMEWTGTDNYVRHTVSSASLNKSIKGQNTTATLSSVMTRHAALYRQKMSVRES